MDQRLMHLWHAQRDAGFAGLAGARTVTTIPVSDDLINEVIALYLPAGGMVQELALQTRADDRLTLVVTLAKPAFLPPIKIRASIERQPELPGSPVLVLKLDAGSGLMRMLGPVVTMLDSRVPGVRLEGDRVHLDLKALLREQASWLDYMERLTVKTEEGRLWLAIEAVLPPR